MERVERCVLLQQRLLTVGRLEREATLGFRPDSGGALLDISAAAVLQRTDFAPMNIPRRAA